MDRISELSDELLVKVLSFLPTKVAVSTSILSKRWECLWMWLPKLEYLSRHCSQSECERLQCFLDRNLPLHRAPVIESFRLNLSPWFFKPENYKMWVLIAVSRYLRELEISYYAIHHPNILPSSLYACKSLVALKLDGNILLDVPRKVGLPSLKTLQLQRVKFLDGETFRRLLSICPLLEDLLVKFRGGIGIGNMGMITVIVPSLRSLSLQIPYDCLLDGLTIDTPCLRYFKFEYYINEWSQHYCLLEKMPMLVEAYVDVNFPDIKSLIRSITSVKRLTLSSEAVYGGGLVFNQLEHLKLCVGTNHLSSLLVRLLQCSPKLRALDLFEMDHRFGDMVCWNQPDTVPTCIMSSLQTFNWSEYLGRPQDRDLAVYILKYARGLKTATFSSDDGYIPKFEMIKELSLSSRASTSCQLRFD